MHATVLTQEQILMWHVHEVISVISCVLYQDWHLICEWRQWCLHWAVISWPHPQVWERSRCKSNDGDALVWDGGSIGILVAHNDNGGSVNSKSVFELGISEFQVGNLLVDDVKVKSVSVDLGSIVVNI